MLNSPTHSLRSGEITAQCPKTDRGATLSPKTQSMRLKWLVEEGYVTRQQAPTIPPAVTYSLTAKGRELEAVIVALDKIFEHDQKDPESAGV